MADEKTQSAALALDPSLVEFLSTLDEGKRALVDAIIEQLKTERAQVIELDGQLVIVTGNLDATKDDLNARVLEIAQAKADLTEAATVISGQADTIKELEAQLVKLQTNPAEFPLITVNKKQYEVRLKKFQFKKVEYTAEALLKNKKLQAELVELGVGFLVEKTENKEG